MFLTHFWSIFPIFWAKKIFWKTRLSRTTSYGFLALRRNLEKTYDAIPRKSPDRWKDRKTDGRTDRPYFIGPYQLPPGVQKGA